MPNEEIKPVVEKGTESLPIKPVENVTSEAEKASGVINTESEKALGKEVNYDGANETDKAQFSEVTADADEQMKKLKEQTEQELNNLNKGENLDNKEEEGKKEKQEQLKEKIAEMLRKNQEAVEKQQQISKKMKEILKSKGYDSKISDLNNKIVHTEISFGKNLIPNREIGLSNLNKIMLKLSSQEDRPYKERLKRELNDLINEISASKEATLYQLIQQMVKSVSNFHDMISAKDFEELFPQAASSDKYHSGLIQEKNKVEDEIEKDPEIMELKKQSVEASKVIEENSSYKIESLEKELSQFNTKTVEQPISVAENNEEQLKATEINKDEKEGLETTIEANKLDSVETNTTEQPK